MYPAGATNLPVYFTCWRIRHVSGGFNFLRDFFFFFFFFFFLPHHRRGEVGGGKRGSSSKYHSGRCPRAASIPKAHFFGVIGAPSTINRIRIGPIGLCGNNGGPSRACEATERIADFDLAHIPSPLRPIAIVGNRRLAVSIKVLVARRICRPGGEKRISRPGLWKGIDFSGFKWKVRSYVSRQSRTSDEPELCETRLSVEKERTNERSIQLARVKGIVETRRWRQATPYLSPMLERFVDGIVTRRNRWSIMNVTTTSGIKTKESFRIPIYRCSSFFFRALDDSFRIFGAKFEDIEAL